MISIQQSDAVKWANEYDGPLFHALLCDPPYHLTTIVKRFGKEGSAPAKFGTDGVFARSSKGFMGKVWDGGDIAFQPETWYAFMRVLHPGAFGMAFASSRGWHRLAVAIEDAGFIIHPTIFGWLYGSGFPKATRIDTQIDRQAGKFDERKVVGKYQPPNGQEWNLEQADNPEVEHAKPTFTSSGVRTLDIIEPATDLAKVWASHRYGLQALKPALEPIIVFQKPYEGRPVNCMVETGAGALNIDGGRIRVNVENEPDIGDAYYLKRGLEYPNQGKSSSKIMGVDSERVGITMSQGRWPSNFILEDEEVARALDEQSGDLGKSSGGKSGHTGAYGGGYREEYYGDDKPGFGDNGGASRFFFNVQERIDESDPVYYCSKASKAERDEGLEECENKSPSFGNQKGDGLGRGISHTRQDWPRKNNHPTVKPIALAKYLSALLLPPEMYAPRRIFVPFAGVASECIGAHQAMWEEIVGIEREKEYCDIAEARVDYWTSKPIQKEMF